MIIIPEFNQTGILWEMISRKFLLFFNNCQAMKHDQLLSDLVYLMIPDLMQSERQRLEAWSDPGDLIVANRLKNNYGAQHFVLLPRKKSSLKYEGAFYKIKFIKKKLQKIDLTEGKGASKLRFKDQKSNFWQTGCKAIKFGPMFQPCFKHFKTYIKRLTFSHLQIAD